MTANHCDEIFHALEKHKDGSNNTKILGIFWFYFAYNLLYYILLSSDSCLQWTRVMTETSCSINWIQAMWQRTRVLSFHIWLQIHQMWLIIVSLSAVGTYCAMVVLDQSKTCFGIFEFVENEAGKQESAVTQSRKWRLKMTSTLIILGFILFQLFI